MATTTGFTVASGTPPLPLAGGHDAAAPVPATTGTETGNGTHRPVGAPSAVGPMVQQQAALTDRGQAASRNGDRAAAQTAPRSADVVVPHDATMAGEKFTIDVEAAPEPPVLPGCDGEASGSGSNGYLPASEMCALWDGGPSIRADAAVALARLNQAYVATFGENMCVTDGYRSYGLQVATKASKGYLAAAPGTSNHGWGLAVDLCPETYSGSRYDWLAANAPAYGWDNPAWAQPGGSKYEPWHWEFTAAVALAGG